MKFYLSIFITIGIVFPTFAQTYEFSRLDTLRGTITPERAWWDLAFYDLNVRFNPKDSTLKGSNQVYYKVLKSAQVLQIDLQRPMQINRIEQDGRSLTYTQDGDAYFVQLQKSQVPNHQESLTVYYEGKPHVARRAPWDGGFVFSKDKAGQPYIATACQGLGASSWWPNKDHPYDEPDSMNITVTVPQPLMDVSNGRLIKTTENTDGTRTFQWKVVNPINNYGVNLNIANYTHWSETYQGLKGPLALNYYVLPEHLELAKKQFQQVPMMLKAFEYWFGPYPFYEDGYKLVEVPYLGMEHQSSVTYGNGFRNGYLGRDLSTTGWGLKWDFIIVHESGHEWFANSITNYDVADMWIHESFTNYSESLFTEYYFGKEAGAAYVIGCRKLIKNDRPVVGIHNLNYSGSGDMYYKGGNLLHMIRQIVNNDERWHQMLLGINKTFYHKTVTGTQVENFISQSLNLKLAKVFEQYLHDIRIPVFTYEFKNNELVYRWENCVSKFDMPVKVKIDDQEIVLKPTDQWQKLNKIKPNSTVTVDINYYVNSKNITKS
ncbi:M1 family metallopeptidase [Siphonobacter sp. SORGH_AS_0500]|uniref:M1 family metallopeptidase n=1 Tax=Siphonobacter sp. SORGH_AS_0500 TaxID=1864824 RepID=UPI00285CE711|nr:M1 family metallopeptidase [Siphonobacter sp. SORGH_AS_0500]MDR6195721.1 aminopeptidase N [Siphonobacter sp. SORGH_AS_0500]